MFKSQNSGIVNSTLTYTLRLVPDGSVILNDASAIMRCRKMTVSTQGLKQITFTHPTEAEAGMCVHSVIELLLAVSRWLALH